MKKKYLMGLTTALVVGAASTTFAAANPFSDVPRGHWAYDAVTQLAADGVIEGYGDGTFLGNRNITRYEMAQMVAKALAALLRAAPIARRSIVLRRNLPKNSITSASASPSSKNTPIKL